MSLWRSRRFLAPYWPSALGAVISLLIVNGATLIYPQLIRRAIDGGIARQNWRAVAVATGILLFLAIVRGICTFLQGYLSEVTSQDTAYALRNAIYHKIQRLGFSYHDQSETGQLLTRMTSDVEMVRQFLGKGLLILVGALVMMIGSGVLLVAMNLKLALLAISVLVASVAVLGQLRGRMQPIFLETQTRLGALNSVLQENLAGIRVVKAFAREEFEQEKYGRANQAVRAANLRSVSALSTYFPVIMLIANLGTALILGYGGLQVIGRTLSLGELVAFVTYLNLLMLPTLSLGMVITQLARAGASAERVFQVLDAEEEIKDRPNAIDPRELTGAVEFRAVCFRYPGSDRRTLDYVSFSVAPGQTVAIVGTTGSGKSTIVSLIPRFYDVEAGQVVLDGHDVRDLTLNGIRRQVGIVLQDVQLFGGTIRDNIAFGRPDAPREVVEAAARAAQADHFISELPRGYDTVLGEDGVGLSGGQRQRLAIARALVVDPRILILDDSTSSVDAETEYRLQLALDQLIAGRTTFIIAQRISSVRRADLILVVDDGRLVAKGTHDELLESSPLYGEIVSSQLREDAPLSLGRPA